jgi:uncharacterized protein YqeY
MSVWKKVKSRINDKNIDSETKDTYKYLYSLFQRNIKNSKDELSDKETISIIKSNIRKINESLDKIENKENKELFKKKNEKFIEICKDLLPKEASVEEIRDFVKTIDFSKLKSKNQAIGIVNKHFKGNVDNIIVKNIIGEY